jgi:hypothetical protein
MQHLPILFMPLVSCHDLSCGKWGKIHVMIFDMLLSLSTRYVDAEGDRDSPTTLATIIQSLRAIKAWGMGG